MQTCIKIYLWFTVQLLHVGTKLQSILRCFLPNPCALCEMNVPLASPVLFYSLDLCFYALLWVICLQRVRKLQHWRKEQKWGGWVYKAKCLCQFSPTLLAYSIIKPEKTHSQLTAKIQETSNLFQFSNRFLSNSCKHRNIVI